ncbi:MULTISPECIES: hypothetical protein [unclassified Paraburkholderia]|uniref:hypothetical protein n=1 Tax=unclassified Paraburkholderia TaxID=2615204 RepID=UPI002AAFE252|nr:MULTISPECIES: hypothetical protein [unclassified Paraburkholderia]
MQFIERTTIIVSYSNEAFESRPVRMRGKWMRDGSAKRAQQRGIDKAVLPLLLAYGQREFDGKGCIRYTMTSDALDTLCRAVGRTKQVQALAGVYALVSVEDPTVVTMGHRYN